MNASIAQKELTRLCRIWNARIALQATFATERQAANTLPTSIFTTEKSVLKGIIVKKDLPSLLLVR